MRIAQIIGTVTLNRAHPSYRGASLKLVVPFSLAELAAGAEPQGDPLVVWDEMGGGHGSQIALSEGAEAAQPFRPEIKPVDAYNAALLDDVTIRPDALPPAIGKSQS